MNTSAYLKAVVDQTRVFADWVDGRDATAPVPTCPKWTLADLVDHVAATQRMVAMLVGERMSQPDEAFARYVPAPADSAEWRAWLTGSAAAAERAFESVSDDTPVWDPSGAEAGVPFWSRRLFGEISVHRADAAATVGATYELEPGPAAEAIQDWLETLTSRGYWENRPDFADALRGTGQTLHFHASDAGAAWLARRERDGIVLERTGGEADVTLSGPADQLLLVLSRRGSLETASGLEVRGDRAMLDLWIEHMDWVTD
ncbi:maleylpyruvate isomerase family mycothiol-dependent enzyme [Allokutzneria sp. NRRL B-24872]|uniref:maleylpyruvate isomerase family mycothiol-dependent enzyme n=1 Tax=Allokutzneria sp. NRRL B-24872 TaxID=1137961 RepID=UPI00143DC840|nr:maleylpyruvate isomerase family mycothiol-dependent enzyme [Allokutzneria sp. NRRL B-24872]